MMSIEEMNSIRRMTGMSYQEISISSGVPIGTVQKVLGGVTKNPRVDTVQRLETVFQKYKGVSGTRENQSAMHSSPDVLHESRGEYYAGGGNNTYQNQGSSAVKASHRWTASEREALPPEKRTELINGVLYDMAAPTPVHQDIAKAFCSQLDQCIAVHHAGCHTYLAPTDVDLYGDESVIVQPDVFIVCNRDQVTDKNVKGAPAFVLEILSSSSRSRDLFGKLYLYAAAGVQEYWIIDPERRQVIVYDMTDVGDGTKPRREFALYGFHDRIPVRISGGKCVIDMNRITGYLEQW